MINEIIFLIHVFCVLSFVWASLRLGKSALISLIVLQSLLANLFVLKQISLFGLQVTCSDVFAVGGLFALNLLREFFGKEAARQSIWISFVSLVFFTLMSQLHLLYLPAKADVTQGAFEQVLTATPRIVLASIAVFYVVQRIDLFLFNFLKKKWEGRKLAIRMGISLFASQLLDTVLFTFLGLYGLVDSVFDVILLSISIKGLVLVLSSPFLALSKRFHEAV